MRLSAKRHDIFDIPTGIFRGFENVGTDYGIIMAILGGDDAGGGVIWAPQVIEDAKEHGLILAETGKLYDSKKGQTLPDGVRPMPLLTAEQLTAYPETPVSDVVPRYVGRYLDMLSLSKKEPARVIGTWDDALIRDRTGFQVEFCSRESLSPSTYETPRHEILMVHKGHWKIAWEGGEAVLAPGDTCAVPPGLAHSLAPSMTGECALFRVYNTDDAAGLTRI